MISPERQRRRERMLGVGMVVLGIATLLNVRADAIQGNEFRACILSQVHGITDSLNARYALIDDDRAATRRVILSVALSDDRTEFRKALDNYTLVQNDISQRLKDHPVPPFPNGKCE